MSSRHSHQVSHSPYASLPNPPVGTVLYDQVYNDDLLYIKVQLQNMLKMNRLTSMPMGFPFRVVSDGYGHSAYISRESYEFQEHFCPSDQRSRTQIATFSYTAPPNQDSPMSWRITVPARNSLINGNLPSKIAIAHVEVDPTIPETSYGVEFMTKPWILLKALSVSIELGVLINITVAKCKTPMLHPTPHRYYPGDIIWIATDNYHRSEVVSVFKLQA